MNRLRFLANINPTTPAFDQLEPGALLPFVPLEAVWPEGLDVSRVKPKSEVSTGYTRFQEGDIVVPKITPTFQADRSTIARGLEGGVAAGTTELHVVRVHSGVDERYVRYLLSSREFLDGGEAEMIGVAGQKRVPDAWLRDFRVPLTDLVRQRAIADYLDAETKRIDALIAKKQRMLEVLEERRSAFVGRAVTVGLDDGPVVSTDSEFAPVVRDGWTLHRLRHVVAEIVDTAHKTAPVVDGGEYLVVRTANVKSGELVLDGAHYTDEAAWREWTARGVPSAGDVIFTREAPAGEACLVPEALPLCIGQRTVLLRPNRSMIHGEWILHSIYSGAAQRFIEVLARSTTVAHINMSDIPDLPVVVPPLHDQEAALSEVRREVSRIAGLKEKLLLQIDLLRERRQALITAAVTGELEIPGVAA